MLGSGQPWRAGREDQREVTANPADTNLRPLSTPIGQEDLGDDAAVAVPLDT
jgi:hypothetical protein